MTEIVLSPKDFVKKQLPAALSKLPAVGKTLKIMANASQRSDFTGGPQCVLKFDGRGSS